jgi:hypothetical protein
VHHKAGEFIEAHAAYQIRSAHGCRKAPIFVRIEFPVAIQVLELKIVYVEDRHGP